LLINVLLPANVKTKKMKKIFFYLCLLIVSLSFSQSQLSNDYSYNVSTPYKVFDADQKYYFTKGNHSIALKFDGKKVLLQKFNNDKPSFVKEKLFENYFPKNYKIERVLQLDSKVYVFYSSWDGDNDNEQLFAVEADFETCAFKDNRNILKIAGKITGKKEFSFWGGTFSEMIAGTQDKFDFLVSHDSKRVLVQYSKKELVKNDKESFSVVGLVTYDSNLKQISEKEITMPYSVKTMNNIDYHLDNDGNLYMLTKVFHDDSKNEKKKRKDELANYHIELFFVANGTNEIKISKFDNKEKIITKLWLFDSDQNFIVCGGFYNNGKGDYFDDVDGLLTFKVDRTGKIYDSYSHEIPLEIINQYESEKFIKKNLKAEKKGEGAKFNDLELNNLLVNQDGSIVLIGEKIFVKSHYSPGMNGSPGRTYYTYHYCDILATKIGVDGSLQWMKKIPKEQSGSRGRGGMSYKYFVANNSHYLLFLDNVKNINLAENLPPALHSDGKGGYLTSVKISDSDGTLKKDSVFNGRDIEDFTMYQFAVDRVFKTSDNSFMIEVYKKKKEDIMIKVNMLKL
jgi:hypothetical protein